jgi:hypothetical protein
MRYALYLLCLAMIWSGKRWDETREFCLNKFRNSYIYFVSLCIWLLCPILSTSLWVLFCNQQHKTYIQYSHQFCSVGQINFMYNRSIKETTITNKIYGKYIVEHVCDLLLGPHEIWVTKEQDTKQFSTIIEWINNAMSNLI